MSYERQIERLSEIVKRLKAIEQEIDHIHYELADVLAELPPPLKKATKA